MLNQSTMQLAVEAVEFVRTSYYRNCGNDPEGMVEDLKELDDALKVLRQVRQMVDGDNAVMVVPQKTISHVVETLCGEIRAQISETGCYQKLDDDGLIGMNCDLATLGVGINMYDLYNIDNRPLSEEYYGEGCERPAAKVAPSTETVTVPKIQLQYVIEKMCDEINEQLGEDDYKVLDREEVTDINQTIATFGVDANMCEYWKMEEDEGDDE